MKVFKMNFRFSKFFPFIKKKLTKREIYNEHFERFDEIKSVMMDIIKKKYPNMNEIELIVESMGNEEEHFRKALKKLDIEDVVD